MTGTNIFGLAPPSQVFVPVRAWGNDVIDNGGDPIARCFSPAMAAMVARLINQDAGVDAPHGT